MLPPEIDEMITKYHERIIDAIIIIGLLGLNVAVTGKGGYWWLFLVFTLIGIGSVIKKKS